MTGEDRKQYAAQILRLSALRGWSELERAAKSELCDALMTCAKSLSHAKAIVDAIVSTENYVPTPARILEIAQSAPPPEQRPAAPKPSCAQCSGTGWRHFWAIASYSVDASGQEVGRPVIDEIHRPDHISPATWDVLGPQELTLKPGQRVYEFVSRCHCMRS